MYAHTLTQADPTFYQHKVKQIINLQHADRTNDRPTERPFD